MENTISNQRMNKLKLLYSDARQTYSDTHNRLCLPKRLRLPKAQALMDLLCGEIFSIVDDERKKDHNLPDLINLSANRAFIEGKGGSHSNRTAIEQKVLQYLHQKNNAPILTLRKSLIDRLQDTDITESVTCGAMLVPFPICYIEFGEPSDRMDCQLTMGMGHPTQQVLTEGVYIAEGQLDSAELLTPPFRSALGIDSKDAVRIIHLSYSGSPCSSCAISNNENSPLFDMCQSILLVVADEDQPLSHMIQTHLDYYSNTTQNFPNEDVSVVAKDHETMLYLLTKALLYMASDVRQEVVERDESELTERLKQVKNATKARKLADRRNRVYDRIIIGPKSPYVPLNERLEQIRIKHGVSAHYRRAHFAIRLTGKGRQNPVMTRIKHTIVNQDKLESMGIDLREYLVE